ncbi:MAG: aminotransferase class V-fold PLP-dependent enzyme, partial [Promethearchaeota archaeon]
YEYLTSLKSWGDNLRSDLYLLVQSRKTIMADVISREFIQTNFPTLSQMIYLNNASTGIPPRSCIDAMKQYLEDRINVRHSIEDTEKALEELLGLLAKLQGGKKEQYGLSPNTTSGINSFAHSIDYPEMSNIVLCDLEFPANYVPWQNVSRLYGPELRVVKSKEGVASLDSFKKHIDENTRVVAVSQVQFSSGYRVDLGGLADAVHNVGGYLVADVIQAIGWAETDLEKENVDFAAGHAAKWLLGPIGTGYVYVSKELIDKLTPRFLGWWGVSKMEDFSYFEREPLPSARMFEIGSPALIGYVGMIESLKTVMEVPAMSREQAAMENADYFRKRLSEEGLSYYDFGTKHNSPIVSCAPEDAEELNKKIAKEKIYCSVRDDRLRVSPHFYNTKQEIDKLVDRLR